MPSPDIPPATIGPPAPTRHNPPRQITQSGLLWADLVRFRRIPGWQPRTGPYLRNHAVCALRSLEAASDHAPQTKKKSTGLAHFPHFAQATFPIPAPHTPPYALEL